MNKGTLVEYVTADLDNQNGFGDSFSNTPAYGFSSDYVVNWKVQAATSGSKKVAGILLKDVVTTINDPWTVDARFVDPAKLAEKQVVPSGRAVPFVTKGIFEVVGLDTSAGAAGPGSGLFVSNSGNGILAVGNAGTTAGRIGTVLTSAGAASGVIVRINVP